MSILTRRRFIHSTAAALPVLAWPGTLEALQRTVTTDPWTRADAIVRGITVRAASFGQSFWGGLKSLGGGNISEFTEVCERALSSSNWPSKVSEMITAVASK